MVLIARSAYTAFRLSILNCTLNPNFILLLKILLLNSVPLSQYSIVGRAFSLLTIFANASKTNFACFFFITSTMK